MGVFIFIRIVRQIRGVLDRRNLTADARARFFKRPRGDASPRSCVAEAALWQWPDCPAQRRLRTAAYFDSMFSV